MLGSSELWNRIDFTRPETLDMYPGPSGSQQLEIRLQTVGHRFWEMLPWPGLCGPTMFGLLVPLRPRIRNLVIHEQCIPLHHRHRFLEESLLKLEKLSIMSEFGWKDDINNERLGGG